MHPSTSVYDVDETSFEERVLERSHKIPVVVDFWASWCAPCRTLAPILEDLVTGPFQGRIELAKVDTETSRELAERFRIRGIPAVKIFRSGEIVQEFVGVLAPEQISAMFESLEPSQADRLYAEAILKADSGNTSEAEELLRRALDADARHNKTLLALASLLENQGDLKQAGDLHRRVGGSRKEESEAKQGEARAAMALEAAEVGEETELSGRIADDPADLDARLALALRLTARSEHRAALEQLMEVVRRDRNYREEAGRKTMLRVFDVIGARSPLADEFRSKLSRALY